MIHALNLTLLRGGLPLFEDASFRIAPQSRVAVTGPNGAGKSSFFELINEQLSADRGEFTLPSDWQIANVAQETPGLERPAVDYVLDGLTQWRSLQAEIKQAEADADNTRLARLHGRMDDIQGYQVAHEAEALMLGLGFAPHDFDRPVRAFSGGWRMRLNLAQALLQDSDLLLLDEPTNHLDLETVEWLQHFLQRYQGTLLVISHDRDFLDAVATHVLSFESRTLFYYTGNFSAFERQRAERRARQAAEFEKQQAQRAEMEQFVARFRYQANKARQAQSRLKALERLTALPPDPDQAQFTFSFQAAQQVSDPLISTRDLALGYGKTAVLDALTFNLHPGARIGLLGRNGAGKSTLIRHLAGELSAMQGQSTTGQHYYPGYFAQHQVDTLEPDSSPLEHLHRIAPTTREQMLRNFLGGFGYVGEQADAAVRTFSGGERARLALALIAWRQPNVLLLDEPTNHLDLGMRRALAEALQSFSGAVVVVSHDRFLLETTVDDYWLVADGSLQAYKGSLDDYLNTELSVRKSSDSRVEAASDPDRKQSRRAAAQQRQRLAPLKKQVTRFERQVEAAQEKVTGLHQQLADPALYEADQTEQLQTVLQAQAQAEQELARAEAEWLDAAAELESATG